MKRLIAETLLQAQNEHVLGAQTELLNEAGQFAARQGDLAGAEKALRQAAEVAKAAALPRPPSIWRTRHQEILRRFRTFSVEQFATPVHGKLRFQTMISYTSWSKPILEVAAAGFGAAVAGPIGGAIGNWLAGAFGNSASRVIESYAKTFGENSAKKLFEMGNDSLTERLGDRSPVLEEAYQTALRQSLADLHARTGPPNQYEDWFSNWDRALAILKPLDPDLIKPDQPAFFADLFTSTMERLDAQGSALLSKALPSLALRPRTIPDALLAELQKELPRVLTERFHSLIVKPEYENAWKEKEQIFQNSFEGMLGRIDVKTDLLPRIDVQMNLLPLIFENLVKLSDDMAVIRSRVPTGPPPNLAGQPAKTVIEYILSQCNRRALFTRMHAQQSPRAMFGSITACRFSVSITVPYLSDKDLRDIALDLTSVLDLVISYTMYLKPEVDTIFTALDGPLNGLKLNALRLLQKMALKVGALYPLPTEGSLAEGYYFTEDEANEPPSIAEIIRAHPLTPTHELEPMQAGMPTPRGFVG